jgi:AraC-like DNA-binding protein
MEHEELEVSQSGEARPQVENALAWRRSGCGHTRNMSNSVALTVETWTTGCRRSGSWSKDSMPAKNTVRFYACAGLRTATADTSRYMSPRNFARLYVKTRGRTPAKCVEAIRIDAATRRLEETAEPISAIAEDCGFTDEEQLRRAFIRALRVPPRDYRKRFGSTGR